MLKITAPIELNMRPEIVTAGEGFCNRMSANYQLMNEDVSPSDMLHITTEPPEFYFGEETRNFYNANTQVNIREENVANIINNLVNRIMVAPEYNMSYQDRVYISNALKKLGIKNEHNFMKQVFNIRDELNNTNELINLYFAYGENIKNLVEEYTDSRKYENSNEVENQSELHLHEDIYNRLETGFIYSIVQNFVENAYGFDVISNNEMMLSEQKTVLENILLKELQNVARGESLPLLYRSDNYYEDYDFTEGDSFEEKISEVINSATLLRFITNAIETKVSANTRNINNWYLVRPGLSSVIENTLSRMENNLRNESVANLFRTSNTEIQNRIRKNEINILNSIIEGDRIYENYEGEELALNITEEGDSLSQQLEQLNESLRIDEKRQEENNIRYEQLIKEEMGKVRKRLSPKERLQRQKQAALASLESPEDVIMTLKMEQTLAKENEEKIKEAARNAAIPKEDRIFNLIDQYIKNPSLGIPGAIVTHDDVSTLAKDIQRVEMLNREIKRESESVNETLEKVSKDISREIVKEIGNINETVENESLDINLVHKTTEEINQYVEDIAQSTPEVIADHNDIFTRERNLERVNMINKASERNSEIVTETIERVSKEVSKEIHKESENRINRKEEKLDNLNLVHRTTESVNLDEVTEELTQRNRRIFENIRQNSEQVNNIERQVTTTVNENQIDYQNIERDIERMVNDSVGSSLNSISDQVYRKIENKLQMEKRRRGL